VLHLADVFQKIIHRLCHRPFPQQYLVPHIHQLIFHIFPQPHDQPDALPVQTFKQLLRNISLSPNGFPSSSRHKNSVKVPAVDTACGKAKGTGLSPAVDSQMQLKAVKPSSGTFPRAARALNALWL
jgi:hypothetical protein